MFGQWDILLWLIVILPFLVLLKRWIGQHAQGVGLLLTGDKRTAFILYSLLLFPGTLVHESSHWLAAQLLRVRVRKISFKPAKVSRGLRLGFVQIARADPIRESLIGLAPLLGGSLVILLIARWGLGVSADISSVTDLLGQILVGLPTYVRVPDFWLLLYLIFAVSNAMVPSPSDRQAWVSLLLYLGLLGLLLYLVGFAPERPEPLVRWSWQGVRYLVGAFNLTVLVDLTFVLAIFLMEKVLEGVTGQRVKYD
ncbi:MAG: hypothetical protein ACE5NP_08795 [Anaerolineae bacterium]